MRALLDGDIYCFRAAASSENEDLEIAIWRMEEMIDNTLAETGADEFSIFLSGENNFRYDIYPEYKANRPKERPRHLKALKDYLIEKYRAQVSDGCEADDLLGIEQCKSDDTIICSIDKDLRMIPGNHYSFEIRGTNNGKQWVRPADLCKVSEFAGLHHFYKQVLVGDSTDNIKGASGIGKVKAERILEGCATEQELLQAVLEHFGTGDELVMNARCLWIWRKPNDDIVERWKELGFETSFGKSERQDISAEGTGLDPSSLPASGA